MANKAERRMGFNSNDEFKQYLCIENIYANMTQVVQDLTVSITLIYMHNPSSRDDLHISLMLAVRSFIRRWLNINDSC